MNKLSRGSQGDATYQISKLFQFQRWRILKMGFFVPMFHRVTPGAAPVLTPGASYEQTGKRFKMRCYVPNIKSLGLPVSEKKNFEIFFLCSYVPTCDPRDRCSFDLRDIKWANLVGFIRRYYIQNIKALAVTFWDKKNFENFLLYLYVKSETPQHTNFHSRAILWSIL